MKRTGNRMKNCRKCSHGISSFYKKCFYRLGVLVGTYPVVVLIGCIGITLGFGVLARINFVWKRRTVSELFAPYYAESHREEKVARSFYSEQGSPFVLMSKVSLRENGDSSNLLGFHQQLRVLLDFLGTEMSVLHNGTNYTFEDLCGAPSGDWGYCKMNEPVLDTLSLIRIPNQDDSALTYPTLLYHGNPVYIGSNFYGVNYDPRGRDPLSIIAAQIILIRYHTVRWDETTASVLELWEEEFLKVATDLTYPGSDSLQIDVFSPNLLTNEVRKAGYQTAPLFFLSFATLMLFTVLSSAKRDSSRSKCWEALGGVICPVMALICGFGVLFTLQRSFLVLMVVTPFLVLAIGIDDAFLLIHAWHATPPSLPVPQRQFHRLGKTFESCGPAVTLTSVTNAVSFGIGATSPTLAIQLFCEFTALSILLDFFFQLTFFGAVLALGGRREEEGRNACLCCLHASKQANPEPKKPSGNSISPVGETPSKDTEKEEWSPTGLAAKAMLSLPVQILTVCCLLLYWALAIWSATRMETDLSDVKVVLTGTPVHRFLRERPRWKEGETISIFVQNVPDLTEPENMSKLKQLVEEFESLPYSVGRNSTLLWLFDYFQEIKYNDGGGLFGLPPHLHPHLPPPENMDSFDLSEIPFLLEGGLEKKNEFKNHFPNISYTDSYLLEFFSAEGRHWRRSVHLNETTRKIEKFVFSTAFAGISTWEEWCSMLLQFRATAEKFPAFNISVYSPFSFYADQVLSIRPLTMTTVAWTFLSMVLACLLFIPRLESVLLALFSLLSINIGVFGGLAGWGVDLDPISMSTILMSIGFSVDYVSHSSYHFFQAAEWNEDPEWRIKETLGAVAWPLVQAGTSTLLAALPFLANYLYMTNVFLKTIVVVVLLGLSHGLWILPVCLGIFAQISNKNRKKVPQTSSNGKTAQNGELPKTETAIEEASL